MVHKKPFKVPIVAQKPIQGRCQVIIVWTIVSEDRVPIPMVAMRADEKKIDVICVGAVNPANAGIV